MHFVYRWFRNEVVGCFGRVGWWVYEEFSLLRWGTLVVRGSEEEICVNVKLIYLYRSICNKSSQEYFQRKLTLQKNYK